MLFVDIVAEPVVVVVVVVVGVEAEVEAGDWATAEHELGLVEVL